MSQGEHRRRHLGSIEAQAARWLARRDRGLTHTERDEYLRWLRQDSRHGAAIARQEPTLERMEQLAFWQPAQSSEPNPDLFAPPRVARFQWWGWAAGGVAVAAFLVVFGAYWRAALVPPPVKAPAMPLATTHLRINENRVLPDGSIVELKDGSRVTVAFTPAERRIRLTGGEAHFIVAKNPHRPFVVEARAVAVRAVGTVFDVRLDHGSVAVLVTEGKVKVEDPGVGGHPTEPNRAAVIVAAGQRTAISQDPVAPAPAVTSVTPAEIRELLAWEAPRLQFYETALGDAVAEFNLHNRRQMILSDRDLGSIPIGGTFRIDNVDGFVHLLEVTLCIHATPHGSDEIFLTRAP